MDFSFRRTINLLAFCLQRWHVDLRCRGIYPKRRLQYFSGTSAAVGNHTTSSAPCANRCCFFCCAVCFCADVMFYPCGLRTGCCCSYPYNSILLTRRLDTSTYVRIGTTTNCSGSTPLASLKVSNVLPSNLGRCVESTTRSAAAAA